MVVSKFGSRTNADVFLKDDVMVDFSDNEGDELF